MIKFSLRQALPLIALTVAVGIIVVLRSFAAAPSNVAGDVNGDGKVDIFDVSALLSHWGTNDAAADLNHDNTVSIFDLSFLLSHWGNHASPTPTPSPSSSPTAGWPDATNTGVPSGVTLTAMSGTITITTAGQVLDAKGITGCIAVRANNVTIKRSHVHDGSCNSGVIKVFPGITGTVITDVEINDPWTGNNTIGIINSGTQTTCTRCYIHDVAQGANVGVNMTVQDSYITALHQYCVDPNVSTSCTHNDNLLSNGPTNGVLIQHNRLENANPQTGNVALFGDFGSITNVTVDNNLMNGAGYTVYGGCIPKKTYPNCTGVVFSNNRFRRSPTGGYFPGGGNFGIKTGVSTAAASGNAWTNNVWDDNGQLIP